MNFKPNLIPNFKNFDLEVAKFLTNKNFQEYIITKKKDGCRLECGHANLPLTRALKPVTSKWVSERYAKLSEKLKSLGVVLEGEFYSHNMTFREINRFFKTEDVTDPKHRKKFVGWLTTYIVGYKDVVEKDGSITKKPIYKKFKKPQDNLGRHRFEIEWPGRSIDWMCTNHDSLKMWIFDAYFESDPLLGYEDRMQKVFELFAEGTLEEFIPFCWIEPEFFEDHQIHTLDQLMLLYQEALNEDFEGLILSRRDRKYKHNRSTLQEGTFFKLKEDKLPYEGVVTAIKEGTQAKAGAPTSTNELGRSVTSKLQEHREPSGLCSGLLTEYNGHPIKVSLKGFPNEAKRELVQNSHKYIGRKFRYTGMPPTKNVPRHAMFDSWY